MGLNKEKVKLSDGTEVEVSQLSFASRMRLMSVEKDRKLTVLDYLSETVTGGASVLESIDDKDGLTIVNGFKKVNPDFQTAPEKTEESGA